MNKIIVILLAALINTAVLGHGLLSMYTAFWYIWKIANISRLFNKD